MLNTIRSLYVEQCTPNSACRAVYVVECTSYTWGIRKNHTQTHFSITYTSLRIIPDLNQYSLGSNLSTRWILLTDMSSLVGIGRIYVGICRVYMGIGQIYVDIGDLCGDSGIYLGIGLVSIYRTPSIMGFQGWGWLRNYV